MIILTIICNFLTNNLFLFFFYVFFFSSSLSSKCNHYTNESTCFWLSAWLYAFNGFWQCNMLPNPWDALVYNAIVFPHDPVKWHGGKNILSYILSCLLAACDLFFWRRIDAQQVAVNTFNSKCFSHSTVESRTGMKRAKLQNQKTSCHGRFVEFLF